MAALPNSYLLRSWGHGGFLGGKDDNKAASEVLELLLEAGGEGLRGLSKTLVLRWCMSPPQPKTVAPNSVFCLYLIMGGGQIAEEPGESVSVAVRSITECWNAASR